MVFVELTPFIHFREEHWTDEDFGALHRFLLVMPTAVDVIRGTHGLRKLRWTAGTRKARWRQGDLLLADLQ